MDMATAQPAKRIRTKVTNEERLKIGKFLAEGGRMIDAQTHFKLSATAVKTAKRYYDEHSRPKNGTAVALAPVAAEARQVGELKAALQHAEEEAHTLQKIIMVLGRSL